MSEHLAADNLRSPFQSAYRKGHSTETALLRIQNDILRSLDKSRGVLVVSIDLSAALDTIDHDILASRLHERMGITGSALRLIGPYLSHRQQTVSVNGESSSARELVMGHHRDLSLALNFLPSTPVSLTALPSCTTLISISMLMTNNCMPLTTSRARRSLMTLLHESKTA